MRELSELEDDHDLAIAPAFKCRSKPLHGLGQLDLAGAHGPDTSVPIASHSAHINAVLTSIYGSGAVIVAPGAALNPESVVTSARLDAPRLARLLGLLMLGLYPP